ncbi:hypothetical protein C7H09_00540 [Marinobacter fuscus]|uniref:Uncharacterized protein n=1 Tax=Marinobacter fuscus TaxID=2109942 RepID=A0A2T1KX69_9GAMM|nr:hypothetical protein [Marinobacter fuscus]PSF14373.1 hypothetical protein C7H09_00540 [Marinobacter fuscus]
MNSVAADRYVTSDFQNSPLLALADLMGLGSFKSQISGSPDLYAPILNGIAVFRHLPASARAEVNRAIRDEVPRGHITQRLQTLVVDQSVQPYWYMWSLSDEELLEFFQFSKTTASITAQMNPVSVPNFTVGALAGAVYYTSKNGLRAQASQILEPFKESGLVKEIARRLGFQNRIVSGIGMMSIPAIIVISGLNIMANKESEMAKRELAARGLLAYSDL